MSHINPDISRKQREFARSKYASSSEDEDERRRSKDNTGSRTLGHEDEDTQDGGHGSSSNGRWHGERDDDHGQHARGSGTLANNKFSKPSKPRRGDSHRREREARMQAHRNDELGINVGRLKLEPELEAASPHTPPNFGHNFFMIDSPSAPRKSFPWMEQSPQQEIFREPASDMTSPIKARGARQSLYASGSSGRRSTTRSIGTSDGFSSLDDQSIRALAVEIRVNIMLTPCLLALRQGKSKTDLAEYECASLTRSARHALALAQQHKRIVAKGTVARCYFYVALTQFAYSPDSIHKSDARALKWLRKTRREFPGSSEADQAQLWVRALESAARQRQRELSRRFDDWAVSDYNGDVIINRDPIACPQPQPRRPPLQRAATWLRNLFGGARPVSMREDSVARGHTKAPTSQRQTTSQLRSDQSWSSDQSFSTGSWSSRTESLRGIILRNGPVGIREETSPSEASPTHMGRNDFKDEQSNGRPAPARSWSNYNPWHNSQAERPSTAESITRWVSEKLGYWLGSGDMSDASSPISDRPMTRESAIPAPLDPRKQTKIPPPLDPRRQSRFKTVEEKHSPESAPSRTHISGGDPSSKSGQHTSRDEASTRSRKEADLDTAGLRRRRSRLTSLVPRLSIQKQSSLVDEDLAEKGESPIFWHE
ncbi:hypothetical protein CBER1_02266 [Cercospora berteroae]|uniref:Uncharacterized protein n=1 Tax=Cercospora berteroae TaxID=357750 RepID=A0A2S6CB16_9PEZI|nr:hypothetical protein CBER1_02266 [Cercospora berteroae]